MCIVSPTTTIQGDLHIDGTLIVDGNVRITGNIEVLGWAKVHKDIDSLQDLRAAGSITAIGTYGSGTDGIISNKNILVTSGKDVIASGVSLVNHTHTGDSGGNTGIPN
jgi:hypothetical protein